MENLLGYNLRRLRELKGWTQKRLAEEADEKQANISNWEQGRKMPAWDRVMALAAALEVSCEDFATPIPPGAQQTPIGRPTGKHK